MPTLNPVINPNIQAEAPVTTQASQAGSTLFQGLTSALGTINTAQPKGPTASEIDVSLNTGLVRGLDTAQALRDQGRDKEALVMERTVTTNFAVAGGDLGSADTRALIETVTGRPIDFVGFSAEEVAKSNAMQTPEFQNYFIGSLADPAMETATDEQRVDYALRRISRAQGNALLIEEAQLYWTNQSEGAYISTISDFMDTNLGALAIADQQGQSLSLATVQETKAQWGITKSTALRRPPNVTNDQWASIKGQTDTIDSMLDYLETMAGNENVSSRLADNMVRAIQDVAKTEGRALNAGENIVLQMVLRHDTQSLLALSEQGTVFSEAITAAEGLAGVSAARVSLGFQQVDTSPDLIDVPDDPRLGWDPEIFTNAKGKDPSASLASAEGLMGLNKGGAKPSYLTDPTYQEQWGVAMSSGFASLYHVTDQNNWVTEGKYRELLSPELFANLETMKSVNPVLYEALRGNAFAAIDKNRASLLANLSQRDSEEVFRYDESTGNLTATLDGVLSSNLIAENIKSALVALVNEQYGGDVNAAFDDAAFNLAPLAGTDITLGKIKEIFKPSNEVVQQVAAYRFLNEQARRVAPEPVKQGETTALGTDTALGAAASPMIALLDEVEGGGDYNTLFGFSNREGNKFSSANITEKTLGELYEFTKGTGEYGQWVKGQVGRVATPLGRYQFVGTTLKAVAEKMGLPDNTVFSPQVQDAIFGFHMNDILSRQSTMEGKMRIARSTWEGFKNVPDASLVRAIESFEKGTPITSEIILSSRGGTPTGEVTTPVRRPAPEPMTTPVQRVPNIEALIESGAKSFESEEELNAAISEGVVEDGELVIVAGRRRIAEKG